MITTIVKKCFSEDKKNIDDEPPILYRQVATIISNANSNRSTISEQINDISRQKAYGKESLKEIRKKYKNYKKTFYSTKIFERMMRNVFPDEIILEILKYL